MSKTGTRANPGAASAPAGDDEVRRLRSIAARVPDPEIPVPSIEDLGVLGGGCQRKRPCDRQLDPDVPGCPAMDEISADVRREARERRLHRRVGQPCAFPSVEY